MVEGFQPGPITVPESASGQGRVLGLEIVDFYFRSDIFHELESPPELVAFLQGL